MTSKQRLLAAIAHQEPDRVPIAPRMHIWAASHYGSHHWLRQLAVILIAHLYLWALPCLIRVYDKRIGQPLFVPYFIQIDALLD